MPRQSGTETRVGTVVSAQEGRFLLSCGDALMHLVVLAPGAGVEPQDLPAIIHGGRSVAVTLRPAEGCHAAVAERLVVTDTGKEPRR